MYLATSLVLGGVAIFESGGMTVGWMSPRHPDVLYLTRHHSTADLSFSCMVIVAPVAME
jgi:hypothetical protein